MAVDNAMRASSKRSARLLKAAAARRWKAPHSARETTRTLRESAEASPGSRNTPRVARYGDTPCSFGNPPPPGDSRRGCSRHPQVGHPRRDPRRQHPQGRWNSAARVRWATPRGAKFSSVPAQNGRADRLTPAPINVNSACYRALAKPSRVSYKADSKSLPISPRKKAHGAA